MSELLNEVLHTIEKAAKILNVSKGTVRNLRVYLEIAIYVNSYFCSTS